MADRKWEHLSDEALDREINTNRTLRQYYQELTHDATRRLNEFINERLIRDIKKRKI